ncbi:MAG: ABC transporter ATP-binding protein [Holosporaceae bacterium]|jgi:ABC-type sugar transport system ATPase subunit|nr:ABC transporter ATP-binding protein [Holosporaceae bacterium]
MASIVLKNVSKCFSDSRVIKDINLAIEDGKCTVLVGPSGCGKSTILRLICGLEEISSGNIFIGDKCVNSVPPSGRGLAMVFQSYALYPHMTVFENMAFALQVRKLKKDAIEERVLEAAKILKIDHLMNRKPKELSGGQRQRVAIGRAIVRNPYAFLFDEPLSNLDTALRCQMRYELAKLKEQLQTTMVYVTHDQAEAMTLADKIVVIRDGVIEQEGSPLELYNSPVNTFVAKFIGSSEMNILEVDFVKSDENLSVFKLLSGHEFLLKSRGNIELSKLNKYAIGIRPEDIEVQSADTQFAGNKLNGIVCLAENLGGDGYVHVMLDNKSQLSIKVRRNITEKPGDHVYLGIKIEKCYLFDEKGNTILSQKLAA